MSKPQRHNPEFAFDIGPIESVPAFMVNQLKAKYGSALAAARALGYDEIPQNAIKGGLRLSRRGRDETPAERDSRLRAGPALQMAESDEPTTDLDDTDAATLLAAVGELVKRLGIKDRERVRELLAATPMPDDDTAALLDAMGGGNEKMAQGANDRRNNRVARAFDAAQRQERLREPAPPRGILSFEERILGRGRAA